MAFFPGQLVEVTWKTGDDPQRRLLLAPCADEDYAEMTGKALPAAARGACWLAATPDGDVYPHPLATGAGCLRTLVPFGRTGQRLTRSTLGARQPANVEVYGVDWRPTPAEFVTLLEFGLGRKLLPLLVESASSSAEATTSEEEEEPEEEKAARPKKKAVPKPSGKKAARDATGGWESRAPTEWALVEGQLPDPGAKAAWHSLAWADGSASGPLTTNKVDVAIIAEGVGIACSGGKNFVVCSTSVMTSVTDARVLPIRESVADGRHLAFRDAVGELTETSWPRFPVSGPRTARWVCRFVRDNDIAPRGRHVKWRSEVNLTATDESVSDHEFCARILQTAATYDQLNVSELASMELVCRRLQMCEYKHRERILGRGHLDELQEDAHLYMGTGETRGMLCISPSLLEYVTDEQHKEAAVMKERRKLRDERALARGSGGGGGGGGDAGGTRARELQSMVDKQKAEISKLKAAGGGGAGEAEKTGGQHGRFKK
jgi:hypothetical protein